MPSGKLASIATPRKGKHGIFASEASDELLELKPSLAWTISSLGSTKLSSRMESVVPLIPRTPGLAESTRLASSAELAPLGWAIDSRPSTRGASSRPSTRGSMRSQQEVEKKRNLAEAKELAEARRALRGITPGDWDAELFAKYHKQFTAEGRWSALKGLAALALKTSKEALKAGCYRVSSHRGLQVNLSNQPLVYWLTADTVSEPEPYAGVPPPLIISHETPLEVVRKLSKCFRHHPVILTMEALDFSSQRMGSSGDTAGHLLEGSHAKSVNQQEMFLCTNFQYASRSASHLCGQGQSPMQKLLARHNPHIFAAENVTCFRGLAADGYPFLSEDELVRMTVLVSGRADKRPWFAERKKGEHFKDKEDFICFMDRLNLWTCKALSLSSGVAPLLVISATDLLEAEHRQPRDGIAQALMTWRSMWAGHFQAVVVACGEASTASLIDKHVNCDIYCKTLRAQPISPSVTQWHWNSGLVALSTNPVFSRIAARMDWEKMMTGSTFQQSKATGGGRDSRRPSAVGMLMMTEAMSQHKHGAGEILLSPSSQGASADDSPLPLPARRQSAENRRNSGKRQSSARRPSMGAGVDGEPETAKEHAERLAKDRLANAEQHRKLDPLSNGLHSASEADAADALRQLENKPVATTTSTHPGASYEDASADVKLNVTTAAAAFKEFVGQKTKEPEPPKEIMTLEIKRQIDTHAEMMDMPPQLKRHCYLAIEAELTGEAESTKEGQKDFDQASESSSRNQGLDIMYAARIFQEVSDRAGELSTMINRKRAEASAGPAKRLLPALTAR